MDMGIVDAADVRVIDVVEISPLYLNLVRSYSAVASILDDLASRSMWMTVAAGWPGIPASDTT